MMYNVFNPDCDSSSRCSTASPAADSFGYNPSPAGSYTSMGSPQSQDFTDLTVSSTSSFVPTVTAISSSPDLQWMVQPLVSSVAPSNRAHPYTPNLSPYRPPMKAQSSSKRGRVEQVCSEEEEKRRVRRERNKQAAAKCRNRRRELTDTLQAETDDLEDDKANLQNDIANLLKEKERLEFILASHRPICKIPSELDAMFPAVSPPAGSALSPCSTHVSPGTTSSSSSSSHAAGHTALTSTSHSLFSSSPALVLSLAGSDPDQRRRPTIRLSVLDDASALEESLDLLARAELEAARSVPEVDLSSSLYAAPQDWEPLYTPTGIADIPHTTTTTTTTGSSNAISMDFEPLCTPVVTCTPSCTTFTSSFVFNYPDAEAFPTCASAHRRGSASNEYSSDSLSSPTLLAL